METKACPDRRRSFLVFISLFGLLTSHAWADVFTVTNTDPSGPGSLAQAITDANNQAGADTIAFNIPGPGVHTITVTADSLLGVVDDVTIDGYTQPGAQPNTLAVGDNAIILIQLDGGGPASTIPYGLFFAAGTSTVRGLSLTGFSLSSGFAISAGNSFGDPFSVNVEGNFIGITPDGTVRGSNSGVISAAVVGGNTPARRNIISGNHIGVDSCVTVLGNYIGTDPSGLQEGFGNFSGVVNSAFVMGNVITGNFNGISAGEGAVIQGNLIGPFADGSPAFGNQIGVRIAQSSNLIGGLKPDEGNVIAYNGTGVQVLSVSDLIPVPVSNSILSNLIFANRTYSIDLNNDFITHNDFGDADTGVNMLQNFPVISGVTRDTTSTTVTGGLNSTPSTAFTLQFFAASSDSIPQGETLLGTETINTSSTGNAFFDFTFPVAISTDEVVTATATDPDGNTSEFFPQDGTAQFANLSTRGNVGTGDNVMIAGFIKSGSKLLIRALGPSLGIPGTLADPKIVLIDNRGVPLGVIPNDNWRDTQEADIIATGLAPTDDREAAIIYDAQSKPFAPPGTTITVSGADGGTGIALVEIYNLDPPFQLFADNFANLSTRAPVGTGDDVLVGGIILRGDAAQSVVVRAIGPDLADAGVAGALQDPTLDLYDSDGTLIVSNDDWRSDQEAEISASGLAPNDDRDAAILVTLLPTSYTAVVRGKNDSTGIGLVEFYKLD